MKRLLLFAVTVLLLGSEARAHDRVSIGFFYSSLESYGEWIAVDGGFFAWRPCAAPSEWRPYTIGRWVWTPDGWYWYSTEPWGWATYHYGRWYYDDFYGWLWIPGYEWAPAWVEWRFGGPTVGWAPLGPLAIFDIHFGVYYHTAWITPSSWWNFVDCRYMADPAIHHHLYRSGDNHRYLGSTRGAGSVRVSGGRAVVRGPDRDDVELRGRIRVRTADVVDGSKPEERVTRRAGKERIEVFRPPVERRPDDEGRRPSHVRDEDRRVTVAPEHLNRPPQKRLSPQDRDEQEARRGNQEDRGGRALGAPAPSGSGQGRREESYRRETSQPRVPEQNGRGGVREPTGGRELSGPDRREQNDRPATLRQGPAREAPREQQMKPDNHESALRPPAGSKPMPAESKPVPRASDGRK